MKQKYRIVEWMGGFVIQIWAARKKGWLWWEKDEWDWYQTNLWGGPYHRTKVRVFSLSSGVFDSLAEAEYQIHLWQKGPVIHNVKEP